MIRDCEIRLLFRNEVRDSTVCLYIKVHMLGWIFIADGWNNNGNWLLAVLLTPPARVSGIVKFEDLKMGKLRRSQGTLY